MTWESRIAKKPKYLRAIGLISTEATALEYHLATLFARTVFIPIKVARAIYLTPRSASARLEILKSAAEAALEPSQKIDLHSEFIKEENRRAKALKRIVSIVKRSHNVLNRRHDVMHNVWGVADRKYRGRVARIQLPPRGPLSAVLTPLRVLHDLTKDIRTLIADVEDLTAEFQVHPPTLTDMRSSEPEKSPSQNPQS